jgi:riboflavin transporter FmnP
MEQQPKLAQSRASARVKILALKDRTASVFVLDLFGRTFKGKRFGYWLANILMMNLLMLGPWLIVGHILNEFDKSRDLLITGVIVVEVVIAGVVVGYAAIQDLFHKLAFIVVEKITDESDLRKLTDWLRSVWSPRSVLPFVLFIGGMWFFIGAIRLSIWNGQFLGIGFFISMVFISLFAGMGFYVTFWVALLALNLRNYQYDLDPILPADSEIVREISEMLMQKIYILATYFAFFTLFGTSRLVNDELRRAASVPFLLIVWAVITAQFILTRSTLGKIVDAAKNKTLSDIRAKINVVRAEGDMAEKETAERVLRLMEMHDRVKSAKVEVFDFKSVTTFITQLMIPLLGFLLANLDGVMRWLSTVR